MEKSLQDKTSLGSSHFSNVVGMFVFVFNNFLLPVFLNKTN